MKKQFKNLGLADRDPKDVMDERRKMTETISGTAKIMTSVT